MLTPFEKRMLQERAAQAEMEKMTAKIKELGGRLGEGAFHDEVMFDDPAVALEFETWFKREVMNYQGRENDK